MYRMLNFTMLNKQEADTLCDNAGIKRREINSRFGWDYTALYCGENKCGEITPKRVGIPLTVAIDLDQITQSMRKQLCI